MKFIYILIIIVLPAFSARTHVHSSDSLSLVELCNAPGGPNLLYNSNWLEGPVEFWLGIAFIGNRVYNVYLFENNVRRHIPTSIGQLTGMVELNLYQANLKGTIPDELGMLTDLYQLDSRECGPTG